MTPSAIGPTTGLNFSPDFQDGIVVSSCPVASSIGLRVLKEGGNAADAAVVVGLALAVTYPQAGNIAGGGFAMVSPPSGEASFLDYRETAPSGVLSLDFSQGVDDVTSPSRFGGTAVATPGTIAGLHALSTRFGSLPWNRVVAPIVELAAEGHWLTGRQAMYFQLYAGELSRFEATRATFLPNGKPPSPGIRCRYPELAKTLQLIAEEGPEIFYRGSIGKALVSGGASGWGVISEDDLRGYEAIWRKPLVIRVRDWDVITAPQPSYGGFVIAMALRLLDMAKADRFSPESVERSDLIARALRIAFRARRAFVADPADPAVPDLAETVKFIRAARDIQALEREYAKPSPSAQPPLPPKNTTHFCVADKNGLVVSNTYSLNTLFGSKVVVPGFGFLLNNTIDDFQLLQGRANWYGNRESSLNRVSPGKRPAGGMAPTVLRRSNQQLVALGAAGGPRIPSLVTQVSLRLIADRASLDEAMYAPRIHHQYFPDELLVEARAAEGLRAGLASRGFSTRKVRTLGIGAALSRDLKTGQLSAILDDRFSKPWAMR